MFYNVRLQIADTIIEMFSKYGVILKDEVLEQLNEKTSDNEPGGRYKNFLYKGERKSDIRIKVKIVSRLPDTKRIESIFITTHFQDGSENWRLLRRNEGFIYKSPLGDKKVYATINKTFDRAVVYILPKKGKGFVWYISDIIYDFLQVLMINYFVKRKGIFIHGMGVKDRDGKGLLFAGKSETGKSTSAKLWHKYSNATVLNDDRIIVCKIKNDFYIYSSPWHGDFSDYLAFNISPAKLEKLFFIHHAKKHIARPIGEKRAFSLLYPSLFPTFWDKEGLEKIAIFCQDLIKNVPCFKLGFKKDKSIIGFVRKIRG